MENEENNVQIAFSAINQLAVNNIPSAEEKKSSTYVSYGERNAFPNFLYDVYSKCPTLQTIINGYSDYVVGDGVSSNVLSRPNSKESWDELMVKLASDYLLYGIAYLQIIRDNSMKIAEIYWLDSMFVRSDEYQETFYYNEDFGKTYVKSSNTIEYPRFKRDFIAKASILPIKTPLGKGTYGSPMWGSALKAVLTEVNIDDFHLNELENNFYGSAIINFNNGKATDEEKDEIEKLITKKFTGHQNAGRFLMSFNKGKDNETTINRLSGDDFDKRFDSLSKKTQKQILTAFGVSPVIFGIEKDTTGFNDEDYQQAFKLFNRTKVQPVQKRLIDTFDRIFGVVGSVKIRPFSIDWSEDEENNDVVE